MKRYIVISRHSGEDCNRALKESLAIGYLTHYDWGCKDGNHTGWAIIEAENKEQAMLSVPTFLRNQAEVVQLTKFDPAKIDPGHVK